MEEKHPPKQWIGVEPTPSPLVNKMSIALGLFIITGTLPTILVIITMIGATKSLQCLTNFMPLWTLQSHRACKRQKLLHRLTPIWAFRNFAIQRRNHNTAIEPLTRSTMQTLKMPNNLGVEMTMKTMSRMMEFNWRRGFDGYDHWHNMWTQDLESRFWQYKIWRDRICFVVTLQQQ